MVVSALCSRGAGRVGRVGRVESCVVSSVQLQGEPLPETVSLTVVVVEPHGHRASVRISVFLSGVLCMEIIKDINI